MDLLSSIIALGLGCAIGIGLVIVLYSWNRRWEIIQKEILDKRAQRSAQEAQTKTSDTTAPGSGVRFPYDRERTISHLQENIRSRRRTYLAGCAFIFAVLVIFLFVLVPKLVLASPIGLALGLVPMVIFILIIGILSYIIIRSMFMIASANGFIIDQLKNKRRYYFELDRNRVRVPCGLARIDDPNPDLSRLDDEHLIQIERICLAVLFFKMPQMVKSLVVLWKMEGDEGYGRVNIEQVFFDEPLESAADYLLSSGRPVFFAWSGWYQESIDFRSIILEGKKNDYIADYCPHKLNKTYSREDFPPTVAAKAFRD